MGARSDVVYVEASARANERISVDDPLGGVPPPVNAGSRNNRTRLFREYILLLGEIGICGAIRLALQHERMNPGHAPGVLGGSGTMTGTPGRHASVVDGPQSLDGYLGLRRNLPNGLGRGILGVEPCGVAGPAGLDALVRAPGDIGLGIPPRHASPAGRRSSALFVLATGQPFAIFQGPIHCLEGEINGFCTL